MTSCFGEIKGEFHPNHRFFRRGVMKSLQSYRGADKSLARPTCRCILFDGEIISFDASLVIYIYK
jgi:hypothetical protein